jgi:hypothetical protein
MERYTQKIKKKPSSSSGYFYFLQDRTTWIIHHGIFSPHFNGSQRKE